MNESRLSAARAPEITVSLPFTHRWMARNSPARRVPSHGTDLFGERYAIDFVAVDERHRTAQHRDWRTLLATEPAARFVAFGQAILAPVDGVVVGIHDGEIDHEARRSPLALVPYAFGQAGRLRQGVGAIAGNHITIAVRESDVFIALAHLRAGSFRVNVGEDVTIGQAIAECGNSGNSTQPHVHMQAMDRSDVSSAHGIPMVFERFREWPRGSRQPLVRQFGVPGESAVVESLLPRRMIPPAGASRRVYQEPPADPADDTLCEGCE